MATVALAGIVVAVVTLVGDDAGAVGAVVTLAADPVEAVVGDGGAVLAPQALRMAPIEMLPANAPPILSSRRRLVFVVIPSMSFNVRSSSRVFSLNCTRRGWTPLGLALQILLFSLPR
ncbi:MAG TPA: hypothetical protein VKX96_17830 [Chloroflexota bacterium]|nr:hypothetical protein [Chloroflexota bacterium]